MNIKVPNDQRHGKLGQCASKFVPCKWLRLIIALAVSPLPGKMESSNSFRIGHQQQPQQHLNLFLLVFSLFRFIP